MQLYLRDDIEAAVRSGALGVDVPAGAAIGGAVAKAVFDALFEVTGQIYRHTERRRTLRFTIGQAAYFAKLHAGVGWAEIAKNLASLKRPVLGARNEYEACRRLREHGVRTPGVAAFGSRGGNPATRRSFVVCDALDGCVSLEDVANEWVSEPKSTALKRRLIGAVGELTSRMHEAGVHHRDYYLCHLLTDAGKLAHGDIDLAVIDLHRAGVSRRGTRRARRRDLAALQYSAAQLPLSRTDLLRFVGAYAGRRPAQETRQRARFWTAIGPRVARLRARSADRGLATGGNAVTVGGEHPASIARLADLDGEPPVPFRFDADLGAGGRRVVCTETLRMQPGRRLVARASVGSDQGIVVKAFCGSHARRDWQRERRGWQAMEAAGVSVPRLVGCGRGADAYVLAFEYIAGARALGPADLPAVVAVLAELHKAGVRQQDLHLGNFLVASGKVFAIDGGGVRQRRMRRAACFRDLARLVADARDSLGFGDLARHYADARGWTITAAEQRRLLVLLASARRRRAAKLVAKTVRDCTPFSVRVAANRLVATARDDLDAPLHAVLADPERAVAMGEPLKLGNTATVVRYGAFVIKRYNVKSQIHRWRLWARPSRARRAWCAAHGLHSLGLPTARPRALIEQSGAPVGGGAAYLVLDYLNGIPLVEAIDHAGADPKLMAAIRTLFAGLRAARLGHGDMKASNFILAGEQVHVVDLDAAVSYRGAGRFRSRHRRDCERFLQNFENAPEAVVGALRQAVAGCP